jgi:hypothetical protein
MIAATSEFVLPQAEHGSSSCPRAGLSGRKILRHDKSGLRMTGGRVTMPKWFNEGAYVSRLLGEKVIKNCHLISTLCQLSS